MNPTVVVISVVAIAAAVATVVYVTHRAEPLAERGLNQAASSSQSVDRLATSINSANDTVKKAGNIASGAIKAIKTGKDIFNTAKNIFGGLKSLF